MSVTQKASRYAVVINDMVRNIINSAFCTKIVAKGTEHSVELLSKDHHHEISILLLK